MAGLRLLGLVIVVIKEYFGKIDDAGRGADIPVKEENKLRKANDPLEKFNDFLDNKGIDIKGETYRGDFPAGFGRSGLINGGRILSRS